MENTGLGILIGLIVVIVIWIINKQINKSARGRSGRHHSREEGYGYYHSGEYSENRESGGDGVEAFGHGC